MRDGLAGVCPIVDRQAETVFLKTFVSGDLLGRGVEGPENRQILGLDVHDRGNVLPGDDQDVNGGLGIDVREGINLIILINRCGFDLSSENVTEDTGIHIELCHFQCYFSIIRSFSGRDGELGQSRKAV
jgi:hypothetical protein